MQTFLGIEIGGTKLQIVLGDKCAKILERVRFVVSLAEGADGIRRQIETTLQKILSATELEAIGVGFGGPVNWRNGKVACSHQVKGWSEFPVGEWIYEMCRVPVFVDNDANVAALGEAIHGAGKSFASVFYVTLGSGVGGGFVSGKKIYHGAVPGESEIGHLRLDKSGRIVEDSCSGWAVDKKICEAISRNKSLSLAKLVGETRGGEAKFLAEGVSRNDPEANLILEETADDLGFALSHITHLFHPEAIILGGGLSLVGEALRKAVQESLDKFVMKIFSPRPKVFLAELGEAAVPIGALALAIRRRDA